MRTIKAECRVPGPRLPIVLREIADRLIADDWCRVSSADAAYYIVGFDAHVADVSGAAEFPISEWPLPTPVEPIAEHLVRAQLAERRDYMKKAVKDLEEAGVPRSAIESFLAGEGAAPRFKESVSREERLRLLSQFLDAWRVSMIRPGTLGVDVDEIREQQRQVDIAREKLCLRELATEYEKIVDRWEQLEPLPYEDSQLTEASKCLLYGFRRAGVVLCAAAVENRLKRIAGVQGRATWWNLMDEAQTERGLNPDCRARAKFVFDTRNQVVHGGWEPDGDIAAEVLATARGLLTDLPPE